MKTSNLIILSALICFVYSCEKKSISKEVKINSATTIADTLYFKNDTIIKFRKLNANAGIFYWGITDQFENQSKDTIPFNDFNKKKLKKIGDFSMLKDGCGSGCNFLFVMDFTKGHNGKLITYPLIENLSYGIIAYKGNDENDLLVIENLKTGKITRIHESYNKNLRPQTLAIDTLYFINSKTLFVSWQDSTFHIKNKSFAF